MGKIWMPGGGGGADLGIITAGASDVLTGKVILDKDGNPLSGTMVNNGAVNQSLAINSTYTIPPGYHNGQGKVTQSIATLAAQTINPTASQQIVSTSGKYMTGNVTVNGVSNLTAANIRKDAIVGGVKGEFQGYVPTATDLYLRGSEITSFRDIKSSAVQTRGTQYTFETGQITVKSEGSGAGSYLATNRDLTGFNYINIQYYWGGTGSYSMYIGVSGWDGSTYSPRYDNGASPIANIEIPNTTAGEKTSSLNISSINANCLIKFNFSNTKSYIYRIWLS